MKPIVSIIMSTYNRSEFLAEAIDSILKQTFKDFEFIIFNDGSTDDTRNIILAYNDHRIKFYDSQENLGYTTRLNEGLDIAQGKYIARMDSDDISHAQRIEQQIDFLEKNNDVAVCGTLIEFIGNVSGNENNWVKILDPEMMKISLLFSCPLCHPTVVFRKEVLEIQVKYNSFFEPSEDYEMWTKFSEYYKIVNLPDVLLKYRFNEGQVSNRKYLKQRKNRMLIFEKQLNKLDVLPVDDELELHDSLFHPAVINPYSYLSKIHRWFDKLIQANKLLGIYDQDCFVNYLHILYSISAEKSSNILKELSISKKVKLYFQFLFN